MPASLECRNCLEPLWLCGDPVCCNHCDHTAKEPRFGEVWEYSDTTRWLVIAPDPSRMRVSSWMVVYLGCVRSGTNGMDLMSDRIRYGRSALDSMAIGQGSWERVE